MVGGLARTERFNGNRFDIGPHRFFTMNAEVNALFKDVCGEELVKVPRLTRIFYRRKFFNYPLTPINALFGVGLVTGSLFFLSYIAARLRARFHPRPLHTFEDWIVDRFGRRLFQAFFKTYTEKVWGISCDRISAEWAGQRIKGLSLAQAIRHALFRSKGGKIKTLVDEFGYPRLGAGQFYERLADSVTGCGGKVELGRRSRRILRDGTRVTGVEFSDAVGATHVETGDFYLSSAPLTEIMGQFDPPPPPAVLEATAGLRYRHHLSVQLLLKGDNPFPDNWIYVHAREVKMARVASYRNFSPDMTSAPDIHPVTVEYFCFEDDPVWLSSEAELLDLAKRELSVMGIGAKATVDGGFVIRSARAYPVIESGYEARIDTIKGWLDTLENFLPIGRSGMFKYNNQDHAIFTGLLGARTATGQGRFDPWRVNIDAVYHESGEAA